MEISDEDLRDAAVTALQDLAKLIKNKTLTNREVLLKIRSNAFAEIQGSSWPARNLGLIAGVSKMGIKPKKSCKGIEILRENIADLATNTTNWSVLKGHLLQRGLLTTLDIEILENEKNEFSKYFEMYKIVTKHDGWPEKLMESLRKSNNEHIANSIAQAQTRHQGKQEYWQRVYIEYSENLAAKLNENEKHANEFEDIISDVSITVTALMDQVSEIEEQNKSLKSLAQQLSSDLQNLALAEQKAWSNIDAASEVTRPSLLEWLKRLQEKIHKLREEKHQLDTKLVQCNHKLEIKNSELRQLQEKLRINQNNLEQLKNEKMSLEMEVEELDLKHNEEKRWLKQQNINLLSSVRLQVLELGNSSELTKPLIGETTVTPIQRKIQSFPCSKNDGRNNDIVLQTEYRFQGSSKSPLQTFAPAHDNLENTTKVVIENCVIQSSLLLNFLKLCKLVKSVHLSGVKLLDTFEEVINLPYLQEFNLHLVDHIFSGTDEQNLIFWASVQNFDFNELIQFKVNIDITANGKRIVKLNRDKCEYIRSFNGFDAKKFHSQELKHVEKGKEYHLNCLALSFCSVSIHPIPPCLTSLILWKVDLHDGNFDTLFTAMNNLKELRYQPNTQFQTMNLVINSNQPVPTALEYLSVSNVSLYNFDLSRRSNTDKFRFFYLRMLCVYSCRFVYADTHYLPIYFPSVKRIWISPEPHKSSQYTLGLLRHFVQLPYLTFICLSNLKSDKLDDPTERISAMLSIMKELGIQENFHTDKWGEFVLSKVGAKWNCVQEITSGSPKHMFEPLGLDKFWTSYDDYSQYNEVDAVKT